MRRCAVLLIFLMALPLLLSCRPEPVAPEQPIVVLLAPGDGATITGSAVEVRIYVQNFRLVANAGTAPVPGEGHAIYYRDETAPLASGLAAVTAPGTYVSTALASYIWQDVTPGQHTFTVQLVNNDDTPLNPPVTVRANVTVGGGA